MPEGRVELAAKFISGNGIEIGALDSPLPVPAAAKVRYVDRVSVVQLRAYYPELGDRPLTEPDLIDDGERLPSIASGSLDFIIANHMLEHCENPLGTLRVHLDRVRSGGVLFYAIPNKNHCFDAPRPLTEFSHLVADDKDGGVASRWSHYLEWATHVNAITDPTMAERNAQENMRNAYSIHFHVWDANTFRAFLDSAHAYLQSAFSVRHYRSSGSEIIAVLQRE
jgi:SAM-dependent methyltransferase